MCGVVASVFNYYYYYFVRLYMFTLKKKKAKAIEFQAEKMYTCTIYILVKN